MRWPLELAQEALFNAEAGSGSVERAQRSAAWVGSVECGVWLAGGRGIPFHPHPLQASGRAPTSVARSVVRSSTGVGRTLLFGEADG